MRASAGVLPLAIAALVVAGVVPGAAAGAETPLLTITAAPSHAAPGGEVTLFAKGAKLSDLTNVRVCGVPLSYSLADGPAPHDPDGSDEGKGADASPSLTASIPADARPSSGEVTSNYRFWLCLKLEAGTTDPNVKLSNAVFVRVDPLPAAPTIAVPVVVPVVVPETRVLGERFTRPAAVPVTAPVQPAKAAVAVARAAGFTG